MAEGRVPLEELLTCSVCLEEFKDPEILSCHHTFCKTCLEEISKRQEGAKVSCPTCRESTEVAAIKPSFTINSLLEMNHGSVKVSSFGDTPECQSHHKPLDTFCKDCDVAICHHCLVQKHQKHTTALISDCFHEQTLPIHGSISKLTKTIGKVHKALESLEIAENKMLDHERSIEEAINFQADGLIQSVNQCRQALLDQARESTEKKLAIIEIQKQEANVKLKQLQACQDSTQLFLQSESQLHVLEKKAELIRKVEHSVENIELECFEPAENNDLQYQPGSNIISLQKLGSLNGSRINEKFSGKSVDSLPVFTVNQKASLAIKYKAVQGSSFRPSASMITSCFSLQDSNEKHDDKPCTVQYNGGMTYSINFTPTMIGSYHVTVTISGQHITGSPFKVQVLQNLSQDIYHIRTNWEKPNGIAVAKDGAIVVTFMLENLICLYLPDGNKRYFNCPMPTDVTFTDNGDILVIDKKNCQLKKLSQQGKLLAATKRVGRFSIRSVNNPIAFTIGQSGQVYVLGYKVKTMVQTGFEIYIVNQDDLSPDLYWCEPDLDLASRPTGIALDSKNNIYITDKEHNCVHKCDPITGSVTTFGSKLLNPMDIAIDKHNTVYVANTDNNRISVFNTDGQFLKCFGKEGYRQGGLLKPHGIVIDDIKGEILVTDTENCRIRIYKSIL